MKYDYIVIGAGAAGLSFAALMEKKGHSVLILEAHSIPGGCSSYFSRDGFIFDAGATTLSGLLPGRPLAELISELNLDLNLVPVNPGLVSMFEGQTINRYRNSQDWISELTKHFPNINHKIIWEKFKKIEVEGWNISTIFKKIPIRKISALFSFFRPELIKALFTLPTLFKSVESELNKHKIQDEKYLALVNELLFITSQNNAKDTPLLMGAMGLCYPEDTAYAMGGMKAFSESLAKKCTNIKYKQLVKKVIPIKKGSDGFTIETGKETFSAKRVVSTIPFWNHTDMFEADTAQEFFQTDKVTDPDKCWSAFMIYLTIPLDKERVGQYFQVHCKKILHCNTHSYFVSLSHPDDEIRSINGRQTVTISTHTHTKEWLSLGREDYLKQKERVKKFILNDLQQKFNLQESDLQNVFTGSPKTFYNYTKRYRGLVGGIPQSLKRNPLDLIIAKSPYKNFYMIGDTQYPGQGIAAVIMGAQNLVDQLSD